MLENYFQRKECKYIQIYIYVEHENDIYWIDIRNKKFKKTHNKTYNLHFFSKRDRCSGRRRLQLQRIRIKVIEGKHRIKSAELKRGLKKTKWKRYIRISRTTKVEKQSTKPRKIHFESVGWNYIVLVKKYPFIHQGKQYTHLWRLTDTERCSVMSRNWLANKKNVWKKTAASSKIRTEDDREIIREEERHHVYWERKKEKKEKDKKIFKTM